MAAVEKESFDVVIIGGGQAGLATSAILKRAYKLKSVVVLEGSAKVGSSWAKRYQRLHLHTPKSTSSLPYAPYPRSFPTYPSKDQVVDYLSAYATQLDLPILLRHHVSNVSYDDTNRLYKVTVQVWEDDGVVPESGQGGYKAPTAKTTIKLMTAKCVVVATGPESIPSIPTFPGQELFKGPIVHSSNYKDGKDFTGKKVLVVGSGNSAGEISLCLSEHGAQPTMLIRRNKLIVIPPDDGLLTSLLLHLDLKRTIRSWTWWLDKVVAVVTGLKAPNLRAYGVPQVFPSFFGNVGVFESVSKMDPPFIDIGQCAAIKKGDIKILRGELRGYGEGTAKIAPPGPDGFGPEAEHSFDAVVLCTGYDWMGSFKSILSPQILAKVLHGCGGRPPSGIETAQQGLFMLGWDDLFGRIAMTVQEAQSVCDSVANRLSALERY